MTRNSSSRLSCRRWMAWNSTCWLVHCIFSSSRNLTWQPRVCVRLQWPIISYTSCLRKNIPWINLPVSMNKLLLFWDDWSRLWPYLWSYLWSDLRLLILYLLLLLLLLVHLMLLERRSWFSWLKVLISRCKLLHSWHFLRRFYHLGLLSLLFRRCRASRFRICSSHRFYFSRRRCWFSWSCWIMNWWRFSLSGISRGLWVWHMLWLRSRHSHRRLHYWGVWRLHIERLFSLVML